MGPAISLREVSLNLAGSRILAPISAELAAGQLHLLVGPNGAGKTSLLKTLLGLCPHRGEIVRHWPGDAEPPAYIPQQPKFDAVLPVTIEDYLAATLSRRPLFLPRSRRLRGRVEALLERVGLQGKAQLSLGQLSGGERQRLMFARALSRESGLWLLDEPMTGLDSAGQRLIGELILQLRAEGRTLVMVHHDMEFVARHADQVLRIDGGLAAAGPPEQVLGAEALTTGSVGHPRRVEVA